METAQFAHWLHVNEMCRHRNYISWPLCFSAEADGSLVCGHVEEGAPVDPPNQEGVIPTG